MKKVIALFTTLLFALLLTSCDSGAGGDINVGDYIEFGKYNWQILDIRNGNALIISERVLETRPYNNKAEDITWAECDLRAYLNGEFYNGFSEDERKRIILTKNENPDNPWDFTEQGGEAFTDGGEKTEDYIFLLSLDEVIQYFTDDGKDSMLYESQLGAREEKINDGYEDRRLAYGLSGDVSVARGTAWFLRSPGMYKDAVSYIGGKGSIVVQGIWAEGTNTGIRPAMWIKNASTLKKSVICDDPDCSVCNSNLYKDNYNPDTDGSCPICGFVGHECKDKVRHNRLFHDWLYGKYVVDEAKIEEVASIKDNYDKTWIKLIDILKDGASPVNENAGTYRRATLVSYDMYNRMNAVFVEKTAIQYNYRSMNKVQLRKLGEELENETAMLEEVIRVSKNTLSEINAKAVTFEDNITEFIGAIAYEYVRTKVKDKAEAKSRELWDAGYYQAIYGSVLDGYTYESFFELSQEEIDKLFGNNRITQHIEGEGAVLDAYFEAVFLS